MNFGINLFQLISSKFLIIFLLIINFNLMYTTDNLEPNQCGQYGFRCVGAQTFEICPIYDGDDSALSERPELHDCKEDLICDEDNPAFCTPIEPLLKLSQSQAADHDDNDELDDEENLLYDYNESDEYFEPKFDDYLSDNKEIRQARASSSSNAESDCNSCETTTTTTIPTPTQTMSTEPPITIISVPEEYICTNYGFYPDSKNSSHFWYCDVPYNGIGYISKHMICGEHRIFVKDFNACVLKGTTPHIRRQIADHKPLQKYVSEEYHEDNFQCNGKKTGKYPHIKNCHLYYVCVNEKQSPIKEIIFMCNKNMAYDPMKKKCSSKSLARCSSRQLEFKSSASLLNNFNNELDEDNENNQDNQLKQSANKICKTPCRFRALNDCQSYYFCTGKQVLKLQCPQAYQFDDVTLECLPKRNAKCVKENHKKLYN